MNSIVNKYKGEKVIVDWKMEKMMQNTNMKSDELVIDNFNRNFFSVLEQSSHCILAHIS